ncbi:MAG: ISAs1 family transposase [Longimicrobiales bacterium]
MDYSDEIKRTNEIKTAAPMLEAIDIAGLDITADALLTQRELASYLVARGAHYHFTVKGNQPTLQENIALLFDKRGNAHHTEISPPDHGRIETRRIWCSEQLNDYLDFPHVGQAFAIERDTIEKKTGKRSHEIAYGITSRPEAQADARRVLAVNRGHWSIENCCHYILDWNYDEDRGRIRTGHGPENVTRLRRFAIGVIKSKGGSSVAQTMRKLNRNIRLVFDYLRMTRNSCAARA